MPAFPYRSILLHAEIDKNIAGWSIIGISNNENYHFQTTLAVIGKEVGEELAIQFADKLAKNLAGKPTAEID